MWHYNDGILKEILRENTLKYFMKISKEKGLTNKGGKWKGYKSQNEAKFQTVFILLHNIVQLDQI